jgi:hypothetical protein
MVRIDNIRPADADGNKWMVTIDDLSGSLAKFRSRSGEVAVAYALLNVALIKSRRSRYRTRRCQRKPEAEPASASYSADRI